MPSRTWHTCPIDTSTVTPASAAERIRQALHDRGAAIERAYRDFWIKVSNEVLTGQISQSDAARVLDMTRESVRLGTRQVAPTAPTGRVRGYPIYLAVAARRPGDAAWAVGASAATGLPTLVMHIEVSGSGGASPWNGDVELAYQMIDAPPQNVHSPAWPPALECRPLFYSQAVQDELLGPPDLASSQRREWEQRHHHDRGQLAA